MPSEKAKGKMPATAAAAMITSFFTKAEGPTYVPPPDPNQPPPLLPPGEPTFKKKQVKRDTKAKWRDVYVWRVFRDGTLTAGCENCIHSFGMASFAPHDCLNSRTKYKAFVEALADYKNAVAKRDIDALKAALAILEETRSGRCHKCHLPLGYLSPNEKACKNYWDDLRKKHCKLNNGCANPDCVERGEEAWTVLQGDHVPSKKKYNLSDYPWWASNGGVPAMEEEVEAIHQWVCGFCHMLEPTGDAAHKTHPDDMPDGKWNGTEVEIKQYDAKRKAIKTYPKREYIDAKKRAVGACAHCERPVRVGEEHCFICDHIDETTKLRGGLARKAGGVAGLVGNPCNDARLEAPGMQKLLDKEFDKCQLLCWNCNHRKTWGYPRRADTYHELVEKHMRAILGEIIDTVVPPAVAGGA
jgi:hypothetical protein